MRREILWLAALLLGAPVLALVLSLFLLNPPAPGLFEFAQIFLFSEVLSLALGYVAFRAIVHLRLAGIHLKVALGYALGFGILALNAILISLPMFISPHDLTLLIILLIFAGLLSAAFSWWLARSITSGLAQLTHTAEKLAQGDLRARAAVHSGDEVQRLAAAFNDMAVQLEQSFARTQQLEEARREVVAAVSHDLRTPLASLRAMLEAIEDGVVTDEATVQRYLRSAQNQVENLSLLVDELFELAQLDASDREWKVEPSSLHDLISDTLESLHLRAEEKQVRLSGQVDPAVDPVLMNSHQLQRVLYNLVQNALRHTPVGGAVFIQARPRENGTEVQVDVSDTGEGIDTRELARVFDPFYRGEKSRSRETGGAGLGLTIARRIVEAHHGQIWVRSERGVGSCFSFTHPRASEDMMGFRDHSS